ncbi:MAG TPA: winged helix-turn-helix domain-containing protein, partial [Anaerolineaceae bacterium]|nr:winged helix-turn-helix domain-containing protein [Anaerolineaceae bacterium]
TVSINKEAVLLTPIECELLSILMRSPNKVFTRAELVDRLYETGFMGLESTLNVHVRNLRAKVEKDPANPSLITTVFGVGYRLNK